MTDPSLLFCVTFALASFWHALNGSHNAWPYLFFIALGLGLLAKGPLILVLVACRYFFGFFGNISG